MANRASSSFGVIKSQSSAFPGKQIHSSSRSSCLPQPIISRICLSREMLRKNCTNFRRRDWRRPRPQYRMARRLARRCRILLGGPRLVRYWGGGVVVRGGGQLAAAVVAVGLLASFVRTGQFCHAQEPKPHGCAKGGVEMEWKISTLQCLPKTHPQLPLRTRSCCSEMGVRTVVQRSPWVKQPRQNSVGGSLGRSGGVRPVCAI